MVMLVKHACEIGLSLLAQERSDDRKSYRFAI